MAARVRKLVGGDAELGNFIVGGEAGPGKSDYEASRRLLVKVPGLPRPEQRDTRFSFGGTPGGGLGGDGATDADSQDVGRRYLSINGGCIYIDLNHLELATPEVLSARDYQAVWSAMLRLAHRAQVAANAELEPGRRIVVLANNSDRQGHSYGGHHSFLLARECWDEMLRQRLYPSLFNLMAFQVSSIVFAGQGKVGSENGAPAADFQISQRADFMETLLGEQTTFHRPLVNSRDEALCGRAGLAGRAAPAGRYARLHVIFYDTTLAPVATALKVGVMQLVLCMIEDGFLGEELVLANPLDALHHWSRDLTLASPRPLRCGRQLTAVELQQAFLERALVFAQRGGFEQRVPDAPWLLALWQDTLEKLARRDFDALRGRLDWVMKWTLLRQAAKQDNGDDWQSPRLRYLDQIYASIDPADSLFLALEEQGQFESVASEEEVRQYLSTPPEDTRAWLRSRLLRAAGPRRVRAVDWDRIDIAEGGATLRLALADPLAGATADTRRLFSQCTDFPLLLRRLQAMGAIAVSRGPHQPAYPATGTPI